MNNRLIGAWLLLMALPGFGQTPARESSVIDAGEAKSLVQLVLAHKHIRLSSQYCNLDQVEKDGKPFVPDYYALSATCDYPNTAATTPFGLYVVSPRTGEVFQFDQCDPIEFPALQRLQTAIMHRTHHKSADEAKYREQAGCTTGAWHWFETCDGARHLGLVVLLDGKSVYRSKFSVCLNNNRPTPTAEERKVVFHFKGGHLFQGEYPTSPTQTIEGNIWQAGADPDVLLLGVTFVSDRVLLNTIHTAKPDGQSVSELDRGIVVRTFPLDQK